MRVVAIGCVKNEIDIVEAFVRHTAALVDQVVVLDNGSTDGTLDVLRGLERSGLALDIVEDRTPGYLQWQRMTRLMREFALERHGADWIFPLDADEFLLVPTGDALRESLARLSDPLLVPWRTYVPDPSDDPSEANPALRIRHRLEQEARPWRKVLVPRRLARRPDATLSQGNHKLLIGGRRRRGIDLPAAALAHIPIRSPGQYGSKVALGALQYMAMSQREPQWGTHYDAPYALLKQDPAAFAAAHREEAIRFGVEPDAVFEPRIVLDPIPYRGDALVLTPPIDDSSRLLRTLLHYAESLALLHAQRDGL